jgi:hypothetical protein
MTTKLSGKTPPGYIEAHDDLIDLPETWRKVPLLNRDTSMKRPPSLSKTALLVALASLQSLAHAGQPGIVPVEMKAGETDQQFVHRVAKGDVVKGGRDQPQIARTSRLLEDKEVLLAFTTPPVAAERPSPDPNEDADITLNAFIKHSAQSYAYLEPVVACEVEGGPAGLAAFFYINVAGESGPLLGVICGWNAYHALADCQLADQVRFYKISETGILVVPMDKYQAALYSQVPAVSDPTFNCTVAKFHNAADVKQLLSEFATKAQPHP